MKQDSYHTSVLFDEVLEALSPAEGKRFIDCTLGGGGHTHALLEAGAEVLGLDQDQEAIDFVSAKLADFSRLSLARTNFVHLLATAQANKFTDVDGVLFDLGVSSHQIDEGSRGFSFQVDAPLDMRMDQSLGVSARDLIAVLGQRELSKLFKIYGGESKADYFAKKIVEQRKTKPIETTLELAELIAKASSRQSHSRLHPATKVFQALRIAVNDEINSLKEALPQAIQLLKPGGVIVVISFHEGEDRVVKHFFRELEENGVLEVVTHKPITPKENEIDRNIRSRSSKLRVATKLAHESKNTISTSPSHPR